MSTKTSSSVPWENWFITMSNGDFLLLSDFTVLSSAANPEFRGCPLRARRQDRLRPSEVILESRKHSALTWAIEINMAWHRERKQVVEYNYINIFLYYIICIKFCYNTRGLNGPWERQKYIWWILSQMNSNQHYRFCDADFIFF